MPQEKTALVPCRFDGCIPRRQVEGKKQAALYTTPETLLALDSQAQMVERWRIWRRDRTNPLAMAGLRITSLAIEHTLGHPHAAKAIELWLDTTESLFKFRHLDSPFAGYIVRWDARTSDNWLVEIDPKGQETPIRPCEFLTNPDPKTWKNQPFLYCTSFEDSRYDRTGDDGARDRFRRWEPSIDEYTGLVVAYVQIHGAFTKDSKSADAQRRAIAERILEKVRTQMRRVARYLQAFAYVLVRPCGGFTFRGCAENNPCLEFPFSRAFQKVLGDPFRVSGTFEDAMRAAGVYDCVFPRNNPLMNATEALNRLSTLPSFARSRDSGLFGSLSAQDFIRAARLLQCNQCFDVCNQNGSGQSFALCYLLSKAARYDPAPVFTDWMALPGAHDYKTLLGLVGDATADETIKRAYFAYFNGAMTQVTSSEASALEKGGERDGALATAIALLLTSPAMFGVDLREKLFKQLSEMAQLLSDKFQSSPIITTDSDGIGFSDKEPAGECCHEGEQLQLICEYPDKVGSWHGFLTALSVAWLHALRAREPEVTFPWNAIALPTTESMRQWRPVTIPAELVDPILRDRLPVPRSFWSGSPSGAIDLLNAAPNRPNDSGIGRQEPPRGQVHRIDVQGSILATTKRITLAAPPRPAPGSNTHQLTAVPNVRSANKGVLSVNVQSDSVIVTVTLGSILAMPIGHASLQADVLVSWTPPI